VKDQGPVPGARSWLPGVHEEVPRHRGACCVRACEARATLLMQFGVAVGGYAEEVMAPIA